MIAIHITTIMGLKALMGEKKDQTIVLSDGDTVRDALNQLCNSYGSALNKRLFDDTGALNPGIAVFVNGCVIHALAGLDSSLKNDDTVLIFPPVGGG